MNPNRKQKADEHKTLHEKISKLEQPPEDNREITPKVNNMKNGVYSLEFFIVLIHQKVVGCLMFIITVADRCRW